MFSRIAKEIKLVPISSELLPLRYPLQRTMWTRWTSQLPLLLLLLLVEPH
jgi:hypothetical protein